MEIMCRVREIGSYGDSRFAAAKAPVGPNDRRERRNRRHRIVQWVLLAAEAENGRGHSQGIHGRCLRGRSFAKHVDCRVGKLSPSGQLLGESTSLGWFGQAAVKEQVTHVPE